MEPEWSATKSEPVSAEAAAAFLRGFLSAPSGAAAAAASAAPASAAPEADAAATGARGASAEGSARAYTTADTTRLLKALEKDEKRRKSAD